MIYFDNAASTPCYLEAIKATQKSMLEDSANPSAAHAFAKLSFQKIEQTRALILKTLNATSNYSVLFLSSATEANNQVIGSFESGVDIFYSQADHASITQPLLNCKKPENLKPLPLNPSDCLKSLPISGPAHLVISHINSQTGLIWPAFEAKLEKPHLKVHVDASQSFGKYLIDLKKYPVDSVVLSAHKMGGPKGVAALVVKNDFSLKTLLFGGGHEGGLRSSTLNTPLILGFKSAIEQATKTQNRQFEKLMSLKSHMIKSLKHTIKDVEVLFDNQTTSPYITLLALPKVPSDVLMRFLEQDQIYLSSSSACSSKAQENPLLEVLKIPKDLRKHLLRVSFSYKTNAYEVDLLCEHLTKHYDRLKGLN